MGYINEQLDLLNSKVTELENRLNSLGTKVENKFKPPMTKIGQETDKSIIRNVPPVTGQGANMGSGIVWNDTDLKFPPYGALPPVPTKAYNQHTHSRFAGGALEISSLEIVEYDLTEYNIHCPQFQEEPQIKQDSEGNLKISSLEDSLVWDVKNKKWRLYAVYKD